MGSYSIHCPSCDSTKVNVYSGKNISDDAIKRYRKCKNCGYTYATVEFQIAEPDSRIILYALEEAQAFLTRMRALRDKVR